MERWFMLMNSKIGYFSMIFPKPIHRFKNSPSKNQDKIICRCKLNDSKFHKNGKNIIFMEKEKNGEKTWEEERKKREEIKEVIYLTSRNATDILTVDWQEQEEIGGERQQLVVD